MFAQNYFLFLFIYHNLLLCIFTTYIFNALYLIGYTVKLVFVRLTLSPSFQTAYWFISKLCNFFQHPKKCAVIPSHPIKSIQIKSQNAFKECCHTVPYLRIYPEPNTFCYDMRIHSYKHIIHLQSKIDNTYIGLITY